MSGRRIELSATQVIASMLAAVTGAVAASYTGIAGTMIGVAVMSVASTAGGAFYKYYLGRSQERLRSAAVVIAPVIAPLANHSGTAGHRRRAGQNAQATANQVRADAGSAAHQGTATGQLSGWPWSPDSPVTDEFPAVSDEASGGWGKPPAETGGKADSPGTRHGAASQATSPGAGHEAASQATSPGTGQATTGQATTGQASTGRGNGRRRWLAVAGTAIGVFVFALGSITAVEMAAGKPLDALIWGRHTTGTTIGDATGAQHGKPAPGPTPSDVTPSPSHRPTTTPPPTPTSTAPAPTPSPSATRSPSPAPSPSQSTGAPAPASPGPTGSLGQ
jgi:hypothetical protein